MSSLAGRSSSAQNTTRVVGGQASVPLSIGAILQLRLKASYRVEQLVPIGRI